MIELFIRTLPRAPQLAAVIIISQAALSAIIEEKGNSIQKNSTGAAEGRRLINQYPTTGEEVLRRRAGGEPAFKALTAFLESTIKYSI